jgi:hypothetical protein
MSIVPKEVASQIFRDCEGMTDAIERAAEWALGIAADACMELANKYQQQACADMPTGECLHLLSKQAAAMDCYNAMRAMMKGGESDGQ